MLFSTGQVVQGRKATYRLLDALRAPTVFKAQRLDGPAADPKFVVFKTALELIKKKALRRERNNHCIPGIRTSPYIRSQYDVVEDETDPDQPVSPRDYYDTFPAGLVFELMETDLWRVPSAPFRQNSFLPKVISRSVLSALVLLKTKYDSIHMDINPNNIFLSDIDSPSPIVKLGDLGNMFLESYKAPAQCLECRAPEVWRGLDVCHAADVWFVGVTLAHWLSHSALFGTSDKIVQDLTEAWCIAKIRRLVGPIDPPVRPEHEDDFKLAKHLETKSFKPQDGSPERPFIDVGTIRQELGKISSPQISPTLLDFIDYLLVIDHTKRPTAAEALQHPYLNEDLDADTPPTDPYTSFCLS